MSKLLARRTSLIGAATLALCAVATVSLPAQAAPGDPVPLTVNVVDQYGRPVPGDLRVVDASGAGQTETTASNMFARPSTHTYSVAGGSGVAFQSSTAWSGFECVGITPCSPAGGQSTTITPVLTVPADTPTTYTVRVTVPSITGTGAVGSPLTLQVPAGLQRFVTEVTAPGSGFDGLSSTNDLSWRRGGAQAASADGPTYVVQRQDRGQSLSLRIQPSQAQSLAGLFLFGPIASFTTNAIAVPAAAPQATTTKVKLPKRAKAGKVALRVTVKSAAGTPDGMVTVQVGGFSFERSLEGGAVKVKLPRLAAGSYKVKVAYEGTEDYQGSTAKKARLKVRG